MSVSDGRRLNRYKEIAARLTSQIDAGVFLPDERLPSVRNLMQREDISVTTALRVFRALEENGRAYARHRSGYFVRPRNSEATWSPPRDAVERRFDGVPVAINHMVVDMLETSAAADILPLGSAVLDRLLIPQSQLSRILISIAKREADKSACYTPPPGLFELRCGIARLMGDRGVLCGPDDIVITAGDSAAIECALRIVARPGDSIAIEMPTYFGILQGIEAAGMKAVEIPTDPATGIDVEQLELAVKSQKIAAVLLNPTLQNPLGFTMPAAHRKRVVELLANARVPLIEDDVFHDLYTGQRQLGAMKSFDRDGMVLYCSSFSKVLTPGYRVGWCLPGRYRRQMMTDFLGRNLSISSLPQMVLSEFLRKDYYDRHIAKLREMFSSYR
jgi:DNA-binding transcriptional MocR family regulator